MKIVTVIGARPQFVKAAMVSRALEESKLSQVVVHTGQHYDHALSGLFFDELKMVEPDYNLGIGSGSRQEQLGQITASVAEVLQKEQPDGVLIYGDTTSSLGGTLAASQMDIPVFHVEGGERIFRRKDVPEETNRCLIDHAAHCNLVSSRQAERYLKREGLAPQRVQFVGDVMYDLFVWGCNALDSMETDPVESFGVEPGNYHLATIHRAEHTKDPHHLRALLAKLDESESPTVMPLHPATEKALKSINATFSGNLRLIPPQGYANFLKLLLNCDKVVTDSGGVTREAFFARKASIIPMVNSWWTNIVNQGWARTVGHDPDALAEALATFEAPATYPDGLFGDGNASARIVKSIEDVLSKSDPEAWHPRGSLASIQGTATNGFSPERYRDFVTSLKDAGYEFGLFNEVDDRLKTAKPFVLMRHDLDMSIEYATRLAAIEHDLGVCSTYFVMVRNPLYNPFTVENSKSIRSMLDMGHALGLHFDCACYPHDMTRTQLSEACEKEADLLGNFFGVEIDTVSYHRPSPLVLEDGKGISGRLMNTYDTTLRRNVQYFSDSRGGWMRGTPLDSEEFAARKPLQVLTHPVWWANSPATPHETLMRFVDEIKACTMDTLEANCVIFRPKNERN